MNNFIKQLIEDGVSQATAQSEFEYLKGLNESELLTMLNDEYGMGSEFAACFIAS